MKRSKSSLSVQDAREMLSAAGLRRTSSRVAVLRYLAEADAPKTHNEVADSLQREGFDRSTIYRCLTDMADGGLLSRFDLGDHVWRFGLQGCRERQLPEHPHFLCLECGKAACLHEVTVRISGGVRPQDWGDVKEIVFKGYCPACR